MEMRRGGVDVVALSRLDQDSELGVSISTMTAAVSSWKYYYFKGRRAGGTPQLLNLVREYPTY